MSGKVEREHTDSALRDPPHGRWHSSCPRTAFRAERPLWRPPHPRLTRPVAYPLPGLLMAHLPDLNIRPTREPKRKMRLRACRTTMPWHYPLPGTKLVAPTAGNGSVCLSCGQWSRIPTEYLSYNEQNSVQYSWL